MVSDYLKLNRDTILQGHGDVCFGDVILPFYPDVRCVYVVNYNIIC